MLKAATNALRPLLVMPLLLALACASSPTAKQSPGARTSSAENAEATPATVALVGTLVGHDGKPMSMAHVSIDGEATLVGKDGSFRIEVQGPDIVHAVFTGVDHGDYSSTIYLERSDVEVLVTLGTYEAPEAYDAASIVQILFKDDGEIALGKTTPMTLGKDGVLSAQVDVKTGEYAYEIRGIVKGSGRSMNSSERTEFRYDGDGNYCNVVSAKEGVLRVTHDPKKTNPAGVKTKIEFSDSNRRTARLAALFALAETYTAINGSETSVEALAKIASEPDEFVRHASAIVLFAGLEDVGPPKASIVALAKQTLDALPTTSPLWSALPSSIATICDIAGPEYISRADGFIEHLVAKKKERAASNIALGSLVAASRRGDEEALQHYYKMINERFANSRVALIAKMFDPNKKVRMGQPVPEFSLENLDGGPKLRNESFAGKVYLVDFWATWCSPCMSEMPNLHAIYKEFKDKGFEILSINVDDKPGRAVALRKAGKFPMPWSNVSLSKEDGPAVKKTFEVSGLPTMVLVDGKGTILAADLGLRGPGLKMQVQRALKKE